MGSPSFLPQWPGSILLCSITHFAEYALIVSHQATVPHWPSGLRKRRSSALLVLRHYIIPTPTELARVIEHACYRVISELKRYETDNVSLLKGPI